VKPSVECGTCIMHWAYSRVASHAAIETLPDMTRRLIDGLLRHISPDANVGSLNNTAVWSVLCTPSPAASYYEELKRESNRNAAALLPLARAYIEAAKSAREKFERACSLAAASNVAPITSPSGAYTFQEIKAIIEGVEETPVIVGDVYDAVQNAKKILYVTDNAGEIGFDSLVIELITRMGPDVTLVVKEDTFFEDATPIDARFFGLDKVVHNIVTPKGFFVPRELSEDLYGVFTETDLIMVKGMGSYETLSGETQGKPAVFMLKVKCDVIARETGVTKGKVVVKLDTPCPSSRHDTTP
jgi:damage-control phosphatase, subfamily I